MADYTRRQKYNNGLSSSQDFVCDGQQRRFNWGVKWSSLRFLNLTTLWRINLTEEYTWWLFLLPKARRHSLSHSKRFSTWFWVKIVVSQLFALTDGNMTPKSNRETDQIYQSCVGKNEAVAVCVNIDHLLIVIDVWQSFGGYIFLPLLSAEVELKSNLCSYKRPAKYL